MKLETEDKDGLIRAGVARADITPPVGIRMIGFAGRGPSIGVNDPLKATALVMTCDEVEAALISCDLLCLDADTVKETREEIGARTSIPPSRIAITCTHTHYGPDPYREQTAPDVVAYQTILKYKLAGAVQEATNDLREVKIGVGWGTSDIGVNRREKRPDGTIVLGQNPNGPIDKQVGVLRIDDRAGCPIACVVNFACHPVSQGGGMRLVSSGYPGRMREVVELLTGTKVVMLQGACGDINPVLMQNSYVPTRTLGTRLGCEVVKIWEKLKTSTTRRLAVASKTVELPRIMYGSQSEAEKLASDLEEEVGRLRAEGRPVDLIHWSETRLKRASEALESWRSGSPLPRISVELQSWRVGSLGLAMAPGEVFNEIGASIKQRSPFTHTFFIGYANGYAGYIPVPEAYPEGGYEVTRASWVEPEAAELITEGCLELLNDLHQA